MHFIIFIVYIFVNLPGLYMCQHVIRRSDCMTQDLMNHIRRVKPTNQNADKYGICTN